MTVLKEGRWPGSYLVSEDPYLSREQVIFASGAVVEAGTVMGRVSATEKYVPLNLTAADGSEVAAGISFDNVDVSGGDRTAVATVRLSAVKASELIWPDGITDVQMKAALAAFEAATIILR